MAYHQEPECPAETQEQEAILGVRVLGIWYEETVIIEEDGHRIFEGDAMLVDVRLGLSRIPFELEIAHSSSVTTM